MRRIWSLTSLVPGPANARRWVRYEGEEEDGEVVFRCRKTRQYVLRIPVDSALFLSRHPKHLGPHTHLGYVVGAAQA